MYADVIKSLPRCSVGRPPVHKNAYQSTVDPIAAHLLLLVRYSCSLGRPLCSMSAFCLSLVITWRYHLTLKSSRFSLGCIGVHLESSLSICHPRLPLHRTGCVWWRLVVHSDALGVHCGALGVHCDLSVTKGWSSASVGRHRYDERQYRCPLWPTIGASSASVAASSVSSSLETPGVH